MPADDPRVILAKFTRRTVTVNASGLAAGVWTLFTKALALTE
jgi:hypothetical protein